MILVLVLYLLIFLLLQTSLSPLLSSLLFLSCKCRCEHIIDQSTTLSIGTRLVVWIVIYLLAWQLNYIEIQYNTRIIYIYIYIYVLRIRKFRIYVRYKSVVNFIRLIRTSPFSNRLILRRVIITVGVVRHSSPHSFY